MTRQEAIKILASRDGHGIPSGYNGGYAEAIEVAIEALKTEPTKHGHWIWTGKERPGAPESLRCSECGFWYVRLTPRFYCSNCGAKMDNAERTYKNDRT